MPRFRNIAALFAALLYCASADAARIGFWIGASVSPSGPTAVRDLGGTQTTNGNFTFTVSPACPNGHMLLMNYAATTDLISAPSGWIELLSGTTATDYQVWYKVCGASEPTTYTWTWDRGSGDGAAFTAVEIQGQNASPIDVAALASVTGVNPSVTTTGANRLIIVAGGDQTSASFTSPPSGYTTQGRFSSGAAKGTGALASKAQASAGATGTSTWTPNQGGQVMTIAIK